MKFAKAPKTLCLEYDVDPRLVRRDAESAFWINATFPPVMDSDVVKNGKNTKRTYLSKARKRFSRKVDDELLIESGMRDDLPFLLDFDMKYGSLAAFQCDCEKVCMNLLISLRVNRRFDDFDFYKYVSFLSCSNLYGADITEEQERDLRRIWYRACESNPYALYAADFRVYKWEVEMVPALIDCYSQAYENGVDAMICSYLCGVPVDDVVA